MKVRVCIPARKGASRFPGKPLAQILGRPMISWVISGVRQNPLVESVILATDDAEIAKIAKLSGAEPVMTPSDLASGTDRIWHACKNLPSVDVVVNIQGDEPLIEGWWIDSLLNPFSNPEIQMTTLGTTLTQEDLGNVNVVKGVRSLSGRALYFSRFDIPFSRQGFSVATSDSCFKHLGVYAYRWSALEKFCSLAPSSLERAESLEQLRALENDIPMGVSIGEFRSQGVDVPDDIKKVEIYLNEKGLK